MLLAINAFARGRHTPDKPFSHYEGTEAELLSLVTEAMEEQDWEPGYRDGVALVNVPPIGFRCGLVDLEDRNHTTVPTLTTVYAPRREGEAPYLQIRARTAEKAQAVAVHIVIYRHDVLAEENENSTDAEWEIISINARPTLAPEPMGPVTMARNFLGMEGGTKGDFSAEEFAKSIMYHNRHVMADPAPEGAERYSDDRLSLAQEIAETLFCSMPTPSCEIPIWATTPRSFTAARRISWRRSARSSISKTTNSSTGPTGPESGKATPQGVVFSHLTSSKLKNGLLVR